MADDENQLPSIDADMLTAVTGGASGGSPEQVTAMLQSLMSSIQDLAKSKNSGGNFMEQFMPIMMMMAMNRPHPQPVVAAAPAVGPDGMPIGPGGWERVA